MDKVQQRRNFVLYVVVVYFLFWVLLSITGLLMWVRVPNLILDIMTNVCAWAPTFTVLILFKKLYPQATLGEVLKKKFFNGIRPKEFVASFLIQVVIFGLSVLAYLAYYRRGFQSLQFISLSGILPLFILTLTSGPLGEELGWRGYALNALQENYSPLRASLILSIIWGFWHTPLWFISGYKGISLIYYIGAFMLAIISLSVIIAFFYNRSRNILSAMWIHFKFDFLWQIVMIDFLHLLIYLSIFYFLTAVMLVLLRKREFITMTAYQNVIFHEGGDQRIVERF